MVNAIRVLIYLVGMSSLYHNHKIRPGSLGQLNDLLARNLTWIKLVFGSVVTIIFQSFFLKKYIKIFYFLFFKIYF